MSDFQYLKWRVDHATKEARSLWSRAREAGQEAQRMCEQLRPQIEELAQNPHFRERYRDSLLRRILVALLHVTHAHMGNIQALDPQTGRLQIQVWFGFQKSFLEYFNSVEPGQATCGTALQTAKRQIVEDATDSNIFRNSRSLEVLLDAGVRAVQSTPLKDSQGRVIGMLSTYYRVPHRPGKMELRKIDHFARHAVRVIEWDLEKRKTSRGRPSHASIVE